MSGRGFTRSKKLLAGGCVLADVFPGEPPPAAGAGVSGEGWLLVVRLSSSNGQALDTIVACRAGATQPDLLTIDVAPPAAHTPFPASLHPAQAGARSYRLGGRSCRHLDDGCEDGGRKCNREPREGRDPADCVR